MKNIHAYIDQLEAQIPNFKTTDEIISKGSVGWHIEHILLTLNTITNALLKTKSEEYKWKFNLPRLIVLTTGKIPRGKAKAPEVVKPQGDISIVSLTENIELARMKMVELEQISEDKFFNHPFFGKLKKKDTIKFLEIHTNHHLKIINELLK